MEILILGSGRVGSAMAIDLAKDRQFNVTVSDRNSGQFASFSDFHMIRTVQADLSDTDTLKKTVKNFDLIINALPGFMGFRTFRSVIETRKNIVDIAFFPEEPFGLDKLARDKNVIAIMDCGVAPGMSNLLIGHVHRLLDSTERAEIYVGGLPVVREWPYEYKAVFSPIDVIEEYTRPSRFVENGKVVTKPALTDPEYLDFPGVGTLEAFNTDGLRTLIETMDIPDMKEKTMRYPGHIEKMKMLRESGFFDQKEIEINGSKIRPLDFTSHLLFPQWELKEGEEDLTVMRIAVEGFKGGRHLRYTYDLFDRFDTTTGTTSMSRTTGYSATAAVRMIAAGVYRKSGVCAPEQIASDPDCVKFMLEELNKRNINYRETIEEI